MPILSWSAFVFGSMAMSMTGSEPVKAIGKKRRSVFVLPKLSLNLTCLGPSAVLVGRLKSGALVPVASAINTFCFG